MDKMDDMSGEEGSGEDELQFGGNLNADIEDDAFMDASDDDSDSDGEEPSFEEPGSRIVDDEDSDEDMVIMDDSESDEDEMATSKKRKSKKDDAEETFADASAYEELINKGWQELAEMRPQELGTDELDLETASSSLKPSSGRKKRKQRPKKKQKS